MALSREMVTQTWEVSAVSRQRPHVVVINVGTGVLGIELGAQRERVGKLHVRLGNRGNKEDGNAKEK
jgi:hypothetical protein